MNKWICGGTQEEKHNEVIEIENEKLQWSANLVLTKVKKAEKLRAS